MVRDWDDMERIWQYIYSKDQLQTFSEEVRDFGFFATGGGSTSRTKSHN